jgi:ribonuclease-3
MDGERRRTVEAFAASVGITLHDGDHELVDQALTHKSYAFEAETGRDNERLEFLGDAVVGLVATRTAYEDFPEYDEGRLSQAKAAVVSRKTLGARARELGFGNVVRFGRGEARSGGALRLTTLGSALEAFVGALYLLRGCETASRWVYEKVLAPARSMMPHAADEDFKSRLQEWTQAHFDCLPQYQKIAEFGPDHCKTFQVEVRVQEHLLGRGEGKRLKDAENIAARQALERLKSSSPDFPPRTDLP